MSREEKAFPRPAPRGGQTDRNSRAPGQIVRGGSRPSSRENPLSRGSSREGSLLQHEVGGSAEYAGPVRQRPPQAVAPRPAQAGRNRENAGLPPRLASPAGTQARQERFSNSPSGDGFPSSANAHLQSEAASSSPGRPAPKKRAGKGRSGMGQVQVFVRWRPMVGDELKRRDAVLGYTCTEDAVSITSDRIRAKAWRGGGFAGVFQDGEDNNIVFERAVTPMLSTVMNGKSACCFCYGHTGSGKTHTILGYGSEFGLYRIGAVQIFQALNQQPGGLHLSVRFAELHCNRAFDLMDRRAECKVREDADGAVHFRKDPIVHADGRVTVQPLSYIRCTSAEDVANAVAVGSKLRVVGSSSLHDQSSRSHAILEMEIVTDDLIAARDAVVYEESMLIPLGKALEEINFNAAQGEDVDLGQKEHLQGLVRGQADRLDAAQERVQEVMLSGPPGLGGTLVLVDLAGSEHGADADATGRKQSKDEIREAKEINQSLLFLKEVVRALATGSGHVPFRSCRLTRVMRHWLRDGCCCSMVANVATSDLHAMKSVSTLQYAVLVASAGA